MSNFFLSQSLSINQQRNARLNEYFAVVGLPDGPLLLSDPPPNLPPASSKTPDPAPPPPPPENPVKTRRALEGGGGGGGVVGARLNVGVVVEEEEGVRVVEVTVTEGQRRNSNGGAADTGGAAAATVEGVGDGNSDKSADVSTSASSASTADLSTTASTTSTSTGTGRATTTPLAAEAGGAPLRTSSSQPVAQQQQQGLGQSDITLSPTLTASVLPPGPPARRRSYGSHELGLIRARAGAAGPLYARFRARVLHRFPGYDHEGDGCAFPTNLPLFCLPGGLKLSLEMSLPTFFTFVHTRANGQHMFGYCLCFHEPLDKRHRSSLQELVDVHNKAARWSVGQEAAGITAPPESLDPEREVYAPKCLCLLSTWPHFGPFKEWLLNLYRISLSPFQIPLERYIGNFLLEVPTPSPGRMEVLYNMGNTTIRFACPPPNKPVAWGSVPFEPLFRCLCHENVLTLFSCLLLERSILLKSSQLSLLTSCAEVLALVLYPFTWSHVYIPVLPEALLGVLAAPMPFLIGVHRSFVEDTECDVAPYVVQVDLDNDLVEMGLDVPMPGLPPKRGSKLLNKLRECAELSYCRTPEYRQDVMQKSDLAFSMAVRPCDYDDDDEETPLPDWDAVREAFLRFFVAMLSGYRRYLMYPTKANPNPTRLFNVDDFLDKLERDSRPFAEAMCDTQAFQNFIDARIQPEAGDLDVVFFDACIAAKRNRSLFHVTKKSDANFLRPETFVKTKTVYALTPDTTGIDREAPAVSHERFPCLSAALYPIPRDIPSLSNPTIHDSGGATKRRGSGGRSGSNSGGSGGGNSSSTFTKYFGSPRKGGGDWNSGSGGEGEERRRRTSTAADRGARGDFRRAGSSRGGDDDWNPLSAEATVFAVFIVGFCATIGVDAPGRKRGGGARSRSSSAGPAPSLPVAVEAGAVEQSAPAVAEATASATPTPTPTAAATAATTAAAAAATVSAIAPATVEVAMTSRSSTAGEAVATPNQSVPAEVAGADTAGAEIASPASAGDDVAKLERDGIYLSPDQQQQR